MALPMVAACADCAMFTSLPILHKLDRRVHLDPSNLIHYKGDGYLPLCKDCDAHETLMSLVMDIHDRVSQLDNEYLRTVEERASRCGANREDEPTPEAWREPETMANRRRLMGLDELTAELIRDRIRKRRQAAESGGTMIPGWKQYGQRVEKAEVQKSDSSTTNLQQKRKIGNVESMTQATRNLDKGGKGRGKQHANDERNEPTPSAKTSANEPAMQEDLVPRGEEASSSQEWVRAGSEVHPEDVVCAHDDDNQAQTIEPSPTTTLSASLSAQEDEPTIKYEAASNENVKSEEEEDAASPSDQPADEPSNTEEEASPGTAAAGGNEGRVSVHFAEQPEEESEQEQQATAEERAQWRAAGWVDPAEWTAAPTEEQLAKWRSDGWLSQEDIEERMKWAEAGWRFD